MIRLLFFGFFALLISNRSYAVDVFLGSKMIQVKGGMAIPSELKAKCETYKSEKTISGLIAEIKNNWIHTTISYNQIFFIYISSYNRF